MSAPEPTSEDAGVISGALLALLVCPIDKGRLDLVTSKLVCSVCGREYPIENGIPNMLVEDGE